jgi:GT2 family glycosyltransferase
VESGAQVASREGAQPARYLERSGNRADRLSVVIATLGRSEVLAETLTSLAECDPPPGEVVVVDGDARGSAAPVVRAFAEREGAPPTNYVEGERGASVQRNIGIDSASGDVVVFVDDDVFLAPDVFDVIARAFDDADVVGATGRIVEERPHSFGSDRSLVRRILLGRVSDGGMTRFGYPRHIQDIHREHDVEFMQGCLMAARRDAAAHVRFDLQLGGGVGYAALEDEDFSYRLSRSGRVRYLPTAVVYHRKSGFRTRDPRFFGWLTAVDRAYLFRKNFRRTPVTRMQFALMMMVLAVHRVVNRQWAELAGFAKGLRDAWRAGHEKPARAVSHTSER